MKKLLLVLIVACITGASLFAWSPDDLTKFPSCMDGNSWILNLGVGLSSTTGQGRDFISIPPLRLSLDKNIGIGDKSLPFFIGGIFGYSGWGYTDRVGYPPKDRDDKRFYHTFSIGGRLGYHFNWDVKNLDTYAVATVGWMIYSGNSGGGSILTGGNIGARYFLSNAFGFWVEAGYTTFSLLDLGLTFKF